MKRGRYIIFYRTTSTHFKSPWFRMMCVNAESAIDALKSYTKRTDVIASFNDIGKLIYHFKNNPSLEYCVVFEKTAKNINHV